MGLGGQGNWGQVGMTLHKVTLLHCFDFEIMHVLYLLETTRNVIEKIFMNIMVIVNFATGF